MRIRVEQKENANYDNPNSNKSIEIELVNKEGLTFGEVLTQIKLLKSKKIKRKINIKRYKKENIKITKSPLKIIFRKTNECNGNELIEDMYIYNEYIASDSLNEIKFNSEEFSEWKNKFNNGFFPPLNAPWQVRRVFRCMENNLVEFEKERFINLKFELWIYLNKTMLVQEKMLETLYGKGKLKKYDKLIMGDIKSIIKKLDTIEGYIELIRFIEEKREKIYMYNKSYSIETDINIFTTIEKNLRLHITEDLVSDDIKNLTKKPRYFLRKYKINNFYN